jgi:hypothetical protein
MLHRSSVTSRRLMCATAAALTVGGLLLPIQPAAAGDGGAVAAGIIGGLAVGALAAGAVRPAPPPVVYETRRVYAAPPPVAYVDEPECGWRRERFWDGYGWRIRRVQVCD